MLAKNVYGKERFLIGIIFGIMDIHNLYFN